MRICTKRQDSRTAFLESAHWVSPALTQAEENLAGQTLGLPNRQGRLRGGRQGEHDKRLIIKIEIRIDSSAVMFIAAREQAVGLTKSGDEEVIGMIGFRC